MLFRSLHLKTAVQAGTMLLAAAYMVLLIYHNLGATQQVKGENYVVIMILMILGMCYVHVCAKLDY